MSEPRTVVVNLLVVRSLEIDEPDWCAGAHGGAQFRSDISHDGPEIRARFDTEDGPVDYLRAWITQAPYRELAPEPLPLVVAEVDGEALPLDPDRVRAFTVLTRAHLDVLDRLADDCERIRSEGP